MKFKDIIKKLINKFLIKQKSLLTINFDKYTEIVETIDDLGLSKELENNMPQDLEEKISRYNSIEDVYNYQLKTKISEQDTLEIVKSFFESIDNDISIKINEILENKSNDVYLEVSKYDGTGEANTGNSDNKPIRVFAPIRGDLRDLYNLVHELTHTLDIENGDTDTRKVLGEVAPQCMERMLDQFLINMSEDEKQKYCFDTNTLNEDINKRKLTTFISRYRNVQSLNHKQGNRILDSRYMLAQIYSTKFMKYNQSEQKQRIAKFIKHVETDEFEMANDDFDIKIDKKNSLQRGFLISDCLDEANKIPNIMEIKTGKVRVLENHNGKKFDLHCYKSNNEMYYLIAIPENFNENCNIVVESYNSEGKTKSTYNENVAEALYKGNAIENLLMEVITDSPIVLPITSDIIEENDTQQLSLEAIRNEKTDLKFMQCIQDAKEKIEQISSKKVSDKVFLNGYSASGVFAQRFALIHPEIIDRCLIGGAAGTIPIPSEELEYPLRNKKL